MSANLTHLPAAPQTEHFDKYAFDNRAPFSSEAHYVGGLNGINGWESTGLAMSDLSGYGGNVSTSRTKHGVGCGRRFKNPSWVNDNEKLLLVVVNYLERRSQKYLRAKRCSSLRSRDLKARLLAAETAIRAKAPALEAVLDRLCQEYMDVRQCSDDPARLRVLQSEIQGLDSQVIFARNPAATITGILYLYYRMGLNSVAVGAELGLKSPAIRQLLFRLWETARALGFPAPELEQRKGVDKEERERRRAEKLAERLVTKEARRKQSALERAQRYLPRRSKIQKSSRAELFAQGLCTACGKEPLMPGRRVGAKCHASNLRSFAKWKAKQKAGVTAPASQ